MDSDVDGLKILADYTFHRVFSHIITNSMIRGVLRKISVSHKIVNGDLVIIYEDDAPGIPEVDKEDLFADEISYENLDFFIVGAIVKASKFTIKETGDPEKGTRIEITVPADRFRIH